MANVTINIPHDQYVKLIKLLYAKNAQKDPSDIQVDEAIGKALDDFITRNSSKEETGIGYQWQELFLPVGTKLRVKADLKGGIYLYAFVDDSGDIIHDDRVVTPNKFLHLYRETNHNTWLEVGILLPNTLSYIIADKLRKSLRDA